MPTLHIHLFNEFQVSLDNQPIQKFDYKKVKALLACLSVESGHSLERTSLAGLLWPDQPETAAHDSLRNALVKLRHAIHDAEAEPPYLLISKDSIQFNPSSDHWLDVRRFTDLLDTCQTHRHRRIEACPACTDRLIETSTLYRGEFLHGFTLPDSDLFEDWLRLRREKYKSLELQVLQDLSSTFEWRGETGKALEYTQRQLELDPSCEDAHVQAMKLYATLGKRSEACEQYEKCREALANELGVEPAEETTHLYESIKYGVYQPSPSRQSTRINNLPTDLTSFVGRENELSEIADLVADPACRLLTLVGPGGVGKTRLAIAAASQQLDVFPNGACFVPLAGVSSIDGLLPSILQALDLQSSQQGDSKKQLLDFLRDKELFIILDNFEHLLEGAAIVTEILQSSPNVMLLVTSRQRLGLQAEWLFEVDGLSYPAGKETRNLATFESVQLFTKRLHQFKPRQTVFDDDLQAASRICRLVEGLPLGIELAASAVRKKSIEQVASAIESGKQDLATSWKDVPERHRSIRAVFDHSYCMLTEREQQAFCGLAVFRGGFTAEAAEHVAGATPNILDALVDRSMLRYDQKIERFNLHEMVRQYALEQLKIMGLESGFRQQHLNYFTNLAENDYATVSMDEMWDDLFAIKPEVENHRTAMEWCFISNNMQAGLILAGALGVFWDRLGHWQELKVWIDKILSSGRHFPRDRHLAIVLQWAGIYSNTDITRGRELLEQSLSIWEELRDAFGIANTAVIVGEWYLRQGDFETARSMFERSLEIFRQIGDQRMVVRTMVSLANYYFTNHDQNDLDMARSLCSQIIEICRPRKWFVLMTNALNILGVMEMDRGDFKKSRALFEEGLSPLMDRGEYFGTIPVILDSLGVACYYLEDYTAARHYYEWGMKIANNRSDRNCATLCNLAYLNSHLGDNEQAMFYFKAVFRQLDFSPDVYGALLDGVLHKLPGVLINCGEAQRAAKLYGYIAAEAEKLKISISNFSRADYTRDLAETRRQLGDVTFNALWKEGHQITLEQARACALEARVRITPPPEAEATP